MCGIVNSVHLFIRGVDLKITQAPPDIEKAFSESLKNLPQGAYALIAASRSIPVEHEDSIKFAHAHWLYWEMQDRKEKMSPVAYHPV